MKQALATHVQTCWTVARRANGVKRGAGLAVGQGSRSAGLAQALRPARGRSTGNFVAPGQNAKAQSGSGLGRAEQLRAVRTVAVVFERSAVGDAVVESEDTPPPRMAGCSLLLLGESPPGSPQDVLVNAAHARQPSAIGAAHLVSIPAAGSIGNMRQAGVEKGRDDRVHVAVRSCWKSRAPSQRIPRTAVVQGKNADLLRAEERRSAAMSRAPTLHPPEPRRKRSRTRRAIGADGVEDVTHQLAGHGRPGDPSRPSAAAVRRNRWDGDDDQRPSLRARAASASRRQTAPPKRYMGLKRAANPCR